MIIRLLKSTAILGVAAFVMLFNTVQTDYKYAITPKGEDDIIKLTVCSDDCTEECKNGLHSFGHSFLTAENLTDSSVMLYDYKMKPHETVTFSWWAVDKHMGVWFNIESCYINLTTRYNNLRTVSMYIDANEVETLSHFLENNDYYTNIFNRICDSLEKNNNDLLNLKTSIIESKNELDIMNNYYNNNLTYLTNLAIITGIRNSISHGHVETILGKDFSSSKIIFKDIY